MKQPHQSSGTFVERSDVATFVGVAAQACVREVIDLRVASVLPANYVVDLVWSVRVFFMEETVLTLVTGTPGDEAPLRIGDVTSQVLDAVALLPSQES